MLLRRVIQHIQDQNWTAVVIDFVIVVVGVFIGIQVANWNDARAERAMERQYVFRLLDDMRRSADKIEGSNRWLSRQVQDERVLLNSLAACAILEDDRSAFVRALGSLGKFEFALIDRQLIDQLRASGQFDVIQNPEIRKRINRMTQASEYQLRVEAQFGEHANPWFNYARRFYFFDSVEGVKSERWETWDNLRFDLETTCQDREFIAAIGNTREATRNLHNWNARILEEVKAVEAALADEIAARGWTEETP